MGDETVTIQALEVIRIDPVNNILLIKGAIPGANGGFVTVSKAIREKVIADAANRGKR